MNQASSTTPALAPDGLMVFDGVCNFCSGAVRLVTLMDPEGLIRFSPIQSAYGQQLCRQAGVDPDDPSTFLFFDQGRSLEATDAMAALVGRLRAPWRWFRFFAAVPRPLRDALYRLVATNRYRLFGKRKTCRVPTLALRAPVHRRASVAGVTTRRVLLVGATGVFGSRLARMLAVLPDLELILAARGLEALTALRRRLEAQGAVATLTVQTFDRARPQDLGPLAPWLVIDTAGPFQDCDYSLALAAVEAGAHYIDLADARAFVAGFPLALQAAASEARVLAITGASSTPALSHAALGDLAYGWRRLDKAAVVISPGGRSPRGLSVIEAILSYVGRPVRVLRHGAWGPAPGWSGLRRLHMPGLGVRWASICDTPDLDLLPSRFGVEQEAVFLAGLDPPAMHLGLALLSLPVRWGWMKSLTPLARLLRASAGVLTPFSSDRGGMTVEVEGLDPDGTPARARWALWALANSGPNTPAAPTAALVRRMLQDREPRRGAYVCAGLVALNEIVAELEGLPIQCQIDEAHPQSPILFRRLLGRRFCDLPASLRAVHGAEASATFAGRALVRSGRALPARLICGLLDLPGTGPCAVEVTLVPDRLGETWTRRFGASQFSSRLVSTRHLAQFEERVGPLRFRFQLRPTQTGVAWMMIGWGVMGLPLPLRFGPHVIARADETQGRYRFRVAVRHPWIGLLFAYGGHLRMIG